MTNLQSASSGTVGPLPGPAALAGQMPLPGQGAALVARARAEARAVLRGEDDRLLVVAGPCSVHDPRAALEYARFLASARAVLAADLLIVMRAYCEKPRTVTGWTGLINDPRMDGSRDIGLGLRTARRLLLDLTAIGVPAACEWLNPAAAPYLADLVTWGAIGARTTESQVHRQLASMLPMPVAFKNGTDGDVQVAVEACLSAGTMHVFPGMDPAGHAAVLTGAGNPDTHVVLRGGRSGPNYAAPDLAKALNMIADAGLPRRVGVDASHANSGKDHRRQPLVAAAVAEQVAAGEHGVALVMLESFLAEGRQEPGDLAALVYGKSVTDGCMGLEATAAVLEALAAAVRDRRRAAGQRARR